jgi:predicted CXXCH cytochrome family protein
MDSAHTKLFNDGNQNAPICADCHNPHTQAPIQKDASGLPAKSEHAIIAKTCAHCHSAIFEEYSQSVHGSGVLVDKNPDVPACTDCHGIHKVTGPSATRFRLSSPQLCGKCHTDETIMNKYGVSTKVLTTYVADFHGTTVTLFQKTDPDQKVNTPVCYDCHGVHNILRVDDPNKGLSVKKNILVACQKCHPDATTNFPDSWLSHYIPSKDKHPLVYWVGVFYKIFIPLVLGGMGVFVVTDIGRKVVDARKKPGKADHPPIDDQTTTKGE